VAVGDFNRDGKRDLVTANHFGNSVTVLLGNGAGGFAAAPGSPFAVGTTPASVAVGDFNGDGKLDLVTANANSNNLTVLLGNGAGGFAAAPGSPVAVGASPIFVAVADLNGDGRLDIVAVNSGDNTLTVLLGNGSGGFTTSAGSPLAAGLSPASVAVGDFNGDHMPDLVAANFGDGTVSVFLGDGLGGFTASGPVAVGVNPASVALGDFNSDGSLDIVTANFGDNTVTELLGDGSGGFTAAPASPFPVGRKPYSIAVADFNGDGQPDITTANQSDNTVTLLLGLGSGTFSSATGSPFTVGATPYSVATGDFNGDGKPDIVTANVSGNTVTVLLNAVPAITVNPPVLTVYASAGLAAPSAIPVSVSSPVAGSVYTASSNQTWLVPTPGSNATGGVTSVSLAASAALLAAGTYTGTVRYSALNFFDGATVVTLHVAGTSGTLAATPGSPFTVGAGPQAVVLADFNLDGKPDVATADFVGNTVTILLGDGLGGFAAAAGGPFAVGVNPASVAVGDFNGDGKPDIVTANHGDNSLTVLLGDGAGGFAAAAGSPFTVGTAPISVAVGDFNGDGNADLVAANNGSNNMTALLGNGSSGFAVAPGSPFAVSASPQSVAVGDVNGDGRQDIVVASFGSSFITTFLGNGLGGFTASPSGALVAGPFPQAVVVADFNGDGKLDVATANSGNNTVSVFLGNGLGGYTQVGGSPFAVGSSPQSIATGDLNGDGKPDIVTANVTGNTITVLLGTGSGVFTLASGSPFNAGAVAFSVAVSDVNGDGRGDVVTADFGANTVSLLLGVPSPTASALTSTAGATVPYGTPVPLLLTVGQPSGGFSQPTGTGTFLDGGIPIGIAAATKNPYTFTTGVLSPGIHTLTASYGGDSANTPSASNTLSLTVTQAGQTIAFAVLPNRSLLTAPFAVGATSSSGGVVAFASTTVLTCTVSGVTVTLVSAGACTIQASQTGNASYLAAPVVNRTFTVMQATQTIAFGALPNVALGTAPFTVAATASSGLAVSFASTTGPVCTVSGAIVTLVIAGTCTIRASQPGDANYAAAPGVNQNFSVAPQAQTITFTAPANQTFGAAPIPLVATASSGLAVVFTSTTAPVCTVTGATATIVSAGTCTVRAAQAGNSTFGAAAPVLQTFTIAQGAQTITFGALSGQTLGTAPFTVSATSSSNLVVAFASATLADCTVAAAKVTMLTAGDCTIQASQAGNANYAAALPVSQTFTVAQGSQTIVFAALPNRAFGVAPFALVATASSGLPVSFASGTLSDCTVNGATLTVLAAGTCTIQAAQAGNSNYSAATPVMQNLTVAPGPQTIAFAALPGQAFGNPPLTVGATASSNLAVSFASTTVSVCSVSGTTVIILTAGACTVQASQAGNGNYAAANPVNQKFQVAQASQTITFGTLPNQTLGAAPFTIGATASSGLAVGFASPTAPVCTVSGAIVTVVATGSCIIQTSQAGNTNYRAALAVQQSFTVGLGAVTVGSAANAGSYASGPFAPDAYIVIFGTGFSAAATQATTALLPTTLGGATVTIADASGTAQAAQLYYVSPTQINLLLPKTMASGAATVTVANSGANNTSFAINIAAVSPAFFTADSSGNGPPAAIALKFTQGTAAPQVIPVFTCSGSPVACTATPIDLGTATTRVYLELFGTGIRGRSGLAHVSVTLGGTALQVTYAGAQGTYQGLDQVNVLLDRSLIGKGQLPLQFTADGSAANPVVLTIK
jgi:uncharacterized protein (TIGR03437 family)